MSLDALRELVDEHGDHLPLDVGACCISVHEQPGLDPQATLEQLDAFAAGVRLPPGELSIYESVARLNHHLFNDLGFSGDRDNYDDPLNSLLDQVIERRLGLPILVSLLYMEVARRLDIEIEGVGFPGHFLVRPHGERFLIDPYNEGRILREERVIERLGRMMRRTPDRAETLAATASVTPRYILVRICNNLKSSWIKRGDWEGALRSVERLRILAPELLEELRDRGVILERLGRHDEAIEAFEQYLVERPDDEKVAAYLDSLKS